MAVRAVTKLVQPHSLTEDVVAIPLWNANREIVAYTVVDGDDAYHAWHHWHRHPAGYAVRRLGKTGPTILLHRAILGLEPGDPLQGDHFNGDRLDNRRSNLRAVTHAQNQQNRPARGGTSRYRGVSYYKRTGRWYASVKVDGRRFSVGYFDTEEEAAAAAAAKRAELMPFVNEERSDVAA